MKSQFRSVKGKAVKKSAASSTVAEIDHDNTVDARSRQTPNKASEEPVSTTSDSILLLPLMTNVNDATTSENIGLSDLLAVVDVGTPEDAATCDDILEHAKLLVEVWGALEITFTLKVAKLLWRAKRAWRGDGKFEVYAAEQLNCSARTVYRSIQVGREISETDFSRIPPPFQTLEYLPLIATELKHGVDLSQILEKLEESTEAESTPKLDEPPPDSEDDSDEPVFTERTDPEQTPSALNTGAHDHPNFRGQMVSLGVPVRLSSGRGKGAVTLTITRVVAARSILEKTLAATEGDEIALGGFTAFVDLDLIVR